MLNFSFYVISDLNQILEDFVVVLLNASRNFEMMEDQSDFKGFFEQHKFS